MPVTRQSPVGHLPPIGFVIKRSDEKYDMVTVLCPWCGKVHSHYLPHEADQVRRLASCEMGEYKLSRAWPTPVLRPQPKPRQAP